jgi:hypothetical protein
MYKNLRIYMQMVQGGWNLENLIVSGGFLQKKLDTRFGSRDTSFSQGVIHKVALPSSTSGQSRGQRAVALGGGGASDLGGEEIG